MLTARVGAGRRWWLGSVVAAAAVVLALLPAAPAVAQPGCDWQNHTHNGDEVWVWTCEDGGGGPGGGGTGEWVCTTNVQGQDQQVPCIHSTFGWFTDIHGGCYISAASPQPSEGSDAWEGNDPSDGVVYDAYCFGTEGVDGSPFIHHPTTIFLDATEGVFADLLERAIGMLPLRGPDIQLAPSPEGAGLVGLPVWMWTPETESTWGEAAVSLEALGLVLNVRANGEQIRWDMGDGTERICRTPGTPYEPSFGAEYSDCGHVYAEPSRDQPGGRYTITATTDWLIEWHIEGTIISGEERTTRTSTESVRINELQVVTS
ncbi:hypothetical protein JQS43_00545 [Natronosporangium hydrolyticum]|uniref:ATP/GTP-binding protein n=1 Tax=Natronosporangium hydrolyticum TaxID=2811111 RepID=A0A895YLF4_9ACTN|nr:hypothetical protein [Natronosporangium hydrolyticum]QSB14920.1 hypothetical protein JQS43_00545 [Natronosporangium hydrolyticum]